MSDCARPISWLQLERYLLGEVLPEQRSALDGHLSACPACRADLDAIADDARPLPPLPEVPPVRATLGRAWAWSAGALVAVAALLLAVWAPWRPGQGPAVPPSRIQTKGGELSMTLLRERAGAVIEDPARYADGDRFRIELTCPPGRAAWDVVVFQDGRAHFPYRRIGQLDCGNRVPLPGAFRLSGEGAVVVCVVTGDDLPQRERIVERGIVALPGEASVCAALSATQR